MFYNTFGCSVVPEIKDFCFQLPPWYFLGVKWRKLVRRCFKNFKSLNIIIFNFISEVGQNWQKKNDILQNTQKNSKF